MSVLAAPERAVTDEMQTERAVVEMWRQFKSSTQNDNGNNACLLYTSIIYKVCKNTMMKRAFEGTDFAGLNEYLEGPSAIAISKDDATAPVSYTHLDVYKRQPLE